MYPLCLPICHSLICLMCQYDSPMSAFCFSVVIRLQSRHLLGLSGSCFPCPDRGLGKYRSRSWISKPHISSSFEKGSRVSSTDRTRHTMLQRTPNWTGIISYTHISWIRSNYNTPVMRCNDTRPRPRPSINPNLTLGDKILHRD